MTQVYDIANKYLVAIDCVVFGYEDAQLKLLLFKRHLEPDLGKWSLVGGWVDADESAEDAAVRVLHKLTGLDNIFLEQVQVFSKPNRDPGGRVLSIVFYGLIDINKHDKRLIDKYGATWLSLNELPEMVFDHNEMFEKAFLKLQETASYELIGRDLLPSEFTISQLRQLYNSIYNFEFDPGNFRKKILSLKVLNRLDKKDTSESKKGAFLYKYKNKEDIDIKERIVNLNNHKIT